MTHLFSIERGFYGQRLVLNGRWHDDIAAYLEREQIVELHLNHAKGWSGLDLSFLEGLPKLVAFSVADAGIQDISPVHALVNLRELEIATYCRTPIDFSRFPKLERCSLYWRPDSESLFSASTITRLFLYGYDGRASKAFCGLTRLEDLTVSNSAMDETEDLGCLQSLTSLRLQNLRNIRSLAGSEYFAELGFFDIGGCKFIKEINAVASLPRLKRFLFSEAGTIASLAPLRGAVALEEVLFYGSTYIVDGNLQPLLELPRLKKAWFKNRRHYSHTRESIASTLQAHALT